MTFDLKTCIVRVESLDGKHIAGTGFVVASDLVVTCAHVVKALGVGPRGHVRFKFHVGEAMEAEVTADGWHPEEDVAFLRPSARLLEGVVPAALGSSDGCSGHAYIALGYPEDGEVQARWPQGNIGGLVPVDGWSFDLLQLQGSEMDKGISGAPVLDVSAGRVVGMITATKSLMDREAYDPKVRYAYAITAETLEILSLGKSIIHRLSWPIESPHQKPDITLQELIVACQHQVDSEIKNLIGDKYMPSLHIDRVSYSEVEKFITKSSTSLIPYLETALSISHRNIQQIREEKAKAQEKLERRRGIEFGENEMDRYEKLCDELDETLGKILEVQGLIKGLVAVINSPCTSYAAVRSGLEEIINHPGCYGDMKSILKSSLNYLCNCLLIKDAAGRGKTNLACALARAHALRQPTVLIAVGILNLNLTNFEKYVQLSLGYEHLLSEDTFWKCVADITEGSNTEFLIILDAINENPDSSQVRTAIQRFLSFLRDSRVKVIVTCRDIYWDGFLHVSGDFWEDRIYKSITLGDFTEEEFSRVLPLYLSRYNLKVILSPEAQEKLRHPLLLRFFCEAYSDIGLITYGGYIEDVRLKPLFDTYWERKIVSVRSKLSHRGFRCIERFLLLVARKMRFCRNKSLTFDDITRITDLTDFDSSNSIYTTILDEGIVLEQSPSRADVWDKPRVVFVYDEFMEYVMARDFVSMFLITEDMTRLTTRFKRLLKSAKHFSSVYGMMTYLLLMLDSGTAFDAWSMVYSAGSNWHLSIAKALSRTHPKVLSEKALAIAARLAHSQILEILNVVLQLAKELEFSEPEKSIPLWVNLMEHQASTVSLTAIKALMGLSQDGYVAALVELKEALYHSDAQVRGAAVYGLAKLNALKPDQLRCLVKDPDGFIREAAFYAISTLENSEIQELEKELFAGLEDRIAHVRIMAAQTIATISSDSSINLSRSSGFLS